MKDNNDNNNGEKNQLFSRRKLLASIGMASLAGVSGAALLSAKGYSSTVADSTYGKPFQGIYELIGDPEMFRPGDPDVIRKMKQESTERAVNLKWFGAKGDGVTDDTEAWNAAIRAVPSGGALFVPPSEGAYFSPNGFVCNRDDITIFGTGQGSRLLAGPQKNTLFLGSPDLKTRRKNIKVHSMKISQTPGPDGSGTLNDFAGLKCWYVDGAVIMDNDFENCDVAVSLMAGHYSLRFPERLGRRNIIAWNRVKNSKKIGIECFDQDHAILCNNQLLNEASFGRASSHGIRIIGSHHTLCSGNVVERYLSGISNQGGNAGEYRTNEHSFIALNKVRYCNIGINGHGGVYDCNLLLNKIEVNAFGIDFFKVSVGGWQNIVVFGNTISCHLDSKEKNQWGIRFWDGGAFIVRENRIFNFGNSMESGEAYHVNLSGITKLGIIEDNYFEDRYYKSAVSRNVGVRAVRNGTKIISRKNVFVSPQPDSVQQNAQDAGTSTGQFIRGYAGIEDMNDYLQAE